MAPKPGKETLIELCTRATELGNGISVRMLEYLSSTKQYPPGFKELAVDFLEICRILWPIEAGLTEAARMRNNFGTDMTQEMERKFRATIDDFIVLNQLLLQFLGDDQKKGLGRLRRGWHLMFAEGEINKMRESLAKNRDALRMSALVFRWSLGEGKANGHTHIGYTGLEAALESMKRGSNQSVVRPAPTTTASAPPHPPPNYALPLPPTPGTTSSLSFNPRSDSYQLPHIPSTSSDRTGSDLLSMPLTPPGSEPHHGGTYIAGGDESMDTLADQFDQQTLKFVPSVRSSTAQHTIGRSTMRQSDVMSDTMSQTTVDLDEMLSQLDEDKSSFVLVRLKADPSSAPRYKPKTNSGANSPGLKHTLNSAVQQKKHDVVEQLLDCGVKPDVGQEYNVLREAILNRDAACMRLLLAYGADPNGVDRNGYTPLHAATELCFLEAANTLLKYGAQPNLCGGAEESPTAMAVIGNRAESLQLFLKYGADVNEIMDNGNTVFVKSMTKQQPTKIVELMIRYGADPNGKNGEGTTALFQAIQHNRVDLMTVLLDNGADPNLPGPKHLLWPSTYKPRCLSLLLSRGADHKKCSGIMELATSINNIESISILLKAGVDPNAKKDGTYTPLCSAIRDNRPQIVSLLLASGADANVPASEYPAFKCVTHNRCHFLPELIEAGADLHHPKGILEKAVKHNNKEALLFLLEHDVSPNARSAEGYTPLTTAIRENRSEMLDILLERGADPSLRGQEWPICMAVKRPDLLAKLLGHLKNPSGAVKGVLEMAVVADQLESIKLLLAAGVSVEDKNGGVFSPLTTSIREDRKEIFRYLIDEGGADVNAPGEHLPIIKAIRRHRGNDLSYIEALLEKGADINKMMLVEKGGGVDLEVEDETGRTVLEIVEGRGWDEAVEILLGEKSEDELVDKKIRRGGWPSPPTSKTGSRERHAKRGSSGTANGSVRRAGERKQ
ncbi:Ankyrin-3 [Cyphellophora attinorum]|uniref:Ankyrin-3 n=1 Tax=Cyphellophora attinorum TaxID=1664694 RepID=A0A0N1GX15_9EURO|nr:Ankyrin-3 [Phialophora attinorum]KPI34526.1 Ankyrin-3 [Phialophora attinorum]